MKGYLMTGLLGLLVFSYGYWLKWQDEHPRRAKHAR